MNYLERLIRRALAVPRDTEQSLFDPFEQTAPWAIDEAAAVRARAPAPDDTRSGQAPRPSVVDGRPASPPIRTEPSSPNAATAAVPPTAGSATQIVRVVEQALTPSAPPPAPTGAVALHEQSLARADAFMRPLELKALSDDPTLCSAEPPPADIPIAASSDPVKAMPRQEPARPRAADPPTIQPVAPHPPTQHLAPHPAERRAPLAKPASTARARRETAELGRPSVITRTVVIAPSRSRQLDDLAHGSGISRFGLGQG
jgi:hypothetical protein